LAVWSLLESALARSGARTAVVDGARKLSWREVHRRASALALHLQARKIGRGDRVALLAWNGLEFLETTFAVAGLGAVLVPLNTRLAAREIEEILRRSGARLLITDGDSASADALKLGDAYESALRRQTGTLAPAEVPEDAIAHLYFTSGTTGRPKGVVLTHENVCAHARAAILELGLGPDDVWAHVAPMFHLADAWATLAITAVGGAHAMLPRFEAEDALALIERERVTITNLVPTMLNRMVRHPRAREYDFGSLRLLLSGGAPIAPALVRETLEVFGCEYAQTYGMTETSPYLTISLLRDHLRVLPLEDRLRYLAKTGRPFGSVELRVVGEDGRDVPPDERAVGEIRVRGSTVSPGYYEDLEATREAFEDGWLKTGDLAVIDGEGYVTIVDRRKDVIKTGGETVYSTEVENALLAHPSVLEVAVFGAPDPAWGERVCAAVVLRVGSSATAEDLESVCRDRIAGFKIPREIRFLDELPKTGSGKISKRLLRS
jgi:acyl-CoA synthetase (AMP-forming)/AMP-acid ligase II